MTMEMDQTKKKEEDINLLRMLYLFCEQNNLSEEDNIQKSFFHLVKWAGRMEFKDEFLEFESYVRDLLKKRIEKEELNK